GNSDGAAIGKLKAILLQAAFEGQARNIQRILETIEFFLFDGEKNGGAVQQGNCGTTSESGDAENVHEGSDQEAPKVAAVMDSQGSASKCLPVAWVTTASTNSLGGRARGRVAVR